MYCGTCKEQCEYSIEDQGIGAYEFWGSPSVDVSYVLVSDCCGDTVFRDEELCIEYTAFDYEQDCMECEELSRYEDY